LLCRGLFGGDRFLYTRREVGVLLDVSPLDLAVLAESGKQVGHPLTGEVNKGGDSGLDLLDGVHGFGRGEQFHDLGLEAFILRLRGRGLPGSAGLLLKKGDLVVQLVGDLGLVGEVRGSNEVEQGVEHFDLSHEVSHFLRLVGSAPFVYLLYHRIGGLSRGFQKFFVLLLYGHPGRDKKDY